MKTMMEFLRSKLFWASMALADAGLGLARLFESGRAGEPETGSKGLMTADEHKDAVGAPWLPALPALPPMPVEKEVYAMLMGGALDGALLEVPESVRCVAVLLVEDKTTGCVEAYGRKEGHFVRKEGKVAGVYRWQMTVGRKGWAGKSGE